MEEGSLVFDDRNQRSVYGDVMLVNGVPWLRMEVANCKYRFRILNASAARNYQLVLSQKAESLMLGDQLIVIGTKYPVGTQLFLRLRHLSTYCKAFQAWKSRN